MFIYIYSPSSAQWERCATSPRSERGRASEAQGAAQHRLRSDVLSQPRKGVP